ncbi:MAG: hypothetical protein Q4F80_08815 [bacterium]|nr:hypothetical protein [bacterium]
MRVSSIGQENTGKTSSVLKAGAAGAVLSGLAGRFAPLTTDEHNFFFNASARDSIKQKVQKVRVNEIQKIGSEFANNTLNVSKEAFDTFESHKDVIAQEPKKALDYVKDSGEAVKAGFKSLVSRVDAVGAAKEHIEVSSIKNAAKSSRSIGFIALAGALVAMSGQIMVNAFKSCLPEEKPAKKPEEHHALTMADVLLEGLGTNTEVLFLTSEMNGNKF